jgi:hypothetical protein
MTQISEYDNSSVGEAEKFHMKYMFAAFTDWQVWLHILVYMSLIGPRELLFDLMRQFGFAQEWLP